MQTKALGLSVLCAWLGACGGGNASAGESTMPNWELDELKRAERDARANASVNVRGIEGTMSSYDVRDTMERRAAEFGACHEPRANALPGLAGTVEFGIQVFADGRVGRVDIRSSDLGDRVLERCLAGVILETKFPRPNGGEANVSYTMILDSAAPGHEPEAWESGRLGRVLEKQASHLREACGLGEERFMVTAYVGPSGRVLSAGVAAQDSMSDDLRDCIADDLRSWPMPKPKSRLAKVSFALGSGT